MFGNSDDRRGKRDLDREFEQGGPDRRAFGGRDDYDYGNHGYNAGQQGPVAYGVHDREMEERSAVYIAKVMGWMCVGLLTTVVTAMAAITIPALATFVMDAFFILAIAQIILVLVLSAMIQRISPATAVVMFMVYSGMMGLIISEFVFMFDLSSLILAFSVTSFMFLSMAAYGFITKKDLTTVGNLARFGLFAIIIAMIVNIFLRSPMLHFVVTIVGVLVFIGLIAYDTQFIKSNYQMAMAEGYDEYSDEVRKLAIIGALKLYLSFINLFIRLLILLGRRR